jgi:hypothetical protein
MKREVPAEIPGQDVCPKIKFGWSTYSMSRPLIECTLRRQVERRANIKVRGGCRVLNIVSESNIQAATGIQCLMVDGSLETLKSDLIVDASGNGSLTVEFLKSTGRRPPEETSIGVSIRYASAVFERSRIQNDYKVVLSFPNAPEQVRAGLILPAENNINQVIAHPWAMSAIPDFIYPDTIGERPADLEDRLNFQRALGRVAVRDVEIYELLAQVRHLLKPLTLLDDPSIVTRVEEEMADAS